MLLNRRARPCSDRTPFSVFSDALAFTRILFFRDSGDGSCEGCSDKGCSTSFSPSPSFMISTILACCSASQCTSKDKITGYSELSKA